MLTVTAEISTKNRYDTTLASAMMTVASQTYPVQRLIVYDDGDHKDLRNIEPFPQILYVLEQKKVAWEIVYAPRRGQVFCHDHALRNATTDLIWRLDDDDFADSATLGRSSSRRMTDGVGAVSGRVWSQGMPMPAGVFEEQNRRLAHQSPTSSGVILTNSPRLIISTIRSSTEERRDWSRLSPEPLPGGARRRDDFHLRNQTGRVQTAPRSRRDDLASSCFDRRYSYR
jgi:hypothetical protein